ncbi:MAG: GNAT family N-acetyltransferase [Phycisphaerae bacterium]|nr:GNAT family N-acetyltransferase [Phycisphaerae bacterium]
MAERGDVNVVVRPMRPADAPSVARLHVSQITAGFLSTLGPRVLTSIYRALPRTRAGFAFVAERDGEVIGFITCATRLKKLYRGILWRKGWLLSLMLLRYVFNPRVLQKMLQTLFYPNKVDRPDLPEAEVLSVVTAPQARGLGIASRLMGRAFEEFARRGHTHAKVLVGADLVPANAYYRKNGFRLAGTIRHHDQPENIYVIDLAGVVPGAANDARRSGGE